MSSEISQSQKTNPARFHVYEVFEAVRPFETDNDGCQELGEGKGSSCSAGVEFQFCRRRSRDPVHSKVQVNATVLCI